MAIPVDSALYISPNTITNLTVWINGVQSSFEYGPSVSGNYLYCLWSGQPTSAILKAPGYQDYSVSLIDGAQYITMTHVPNNLYAWTYNASLGATFWTDTPTPTTTSHIYDSNGNDVTNTYIYGGDTFADITNTSSSVITYVVTWGSPSSSYTATLPIGYNYSKSDVIIK